MSVPALLEQREPSDGTLKYTFGCLAPSESAFLLLSTQFAKLLEHLEAGAEAKTADGLATAVIANSVLTVADVDLALASLLTELGVRSEGPSYWPRFDTRRSNSDSGSRLLRHEAIAERENGLRCQSTHYDFSVAVITFVARSRNQNRQELHSQSCFEIVGQAAACFVILWTASCRSSDTCMQSAICSKRFS